MKTGLKETRGGEIIKRYKYKSQLLGWNMQTGKWFGRVQKFRVSAAMSLKITALLDLLLVKMNLFCLLVRSTLWESDAKAAHLANPWQHWGSQPRVPSTDSHPTRSGIDSALAGLSHTPFPWPALPPQCKGSMKQPIHLVWQEWKAWRWELVISVSHSSLQGFGLWMLG